MKAAKPAAAQLGRLPAPVPAVALAISDAEIARRMQDFSHELGKVAAPVRQGLGKPYARFEFKTNEDLKAFIRKVDSECEPCQAVPECAPAVSVPGRKAAAEMYPLAEIRTDEHRFQNRQSAFSELSAESVAKHYDPNKFDPIVVWLDPADGQVYVLSGHSRYEGMRRRGESDIPVRFFNGTEAEAIHFARVDANRAATPENLLEDMNAYRLSRDGDPARGIPPLKKGELKRTFRGKDVKLEMWSHLDPGGKFIAALGSENPSEYPFIQNRALWVGELRKENPRMTNLHEDDTFNAFYGGTALASMDKDTFFAEIRKRLAWGKDRLFPECQGLDCSPLRDLSEQGGHKDAYRRIAELQAEIDALTARLNARGEANKIYSEQERSMYKRLRQEAFDEQERIKRDIDFLDNQPGLFGYTLGKVYQGPNKEAYQRIDELQTRIDAINARLEARAELKRIYSDIERNIYKGMRQDAYEEQQRIKRDIDFLEKQPGLFGTKQRRTR